MADRSRKFQPTDDLRLLRAAYSPGSGLSAPERGVLTVLVLHRNGDTGRCDPSLSTIALESGLGRSTVVRALGALEEREWVQRAPVPGVRTSYLLRAPTSARVGLVTARDITRHPSHSGTSRAPTSPGAGPVPERDPSRSGTTPVPERDGTRPGAGPERTKERAKERAEGSSTLLTTRLPSGGARDPEREALEQRVLSMGDRADPKRPPRRVDLKSVTKRARPILRKHCLLGRDHGVDENGQEIGTGLLIRQLEDLLSEGWELDEVLGAVQFVRRDESAPPAGAAFSFHWFDAQPGRWARCIGAWQKSL